MYYKKLVLFRFIWNEIIDVEYDIKTSNVVQVPIYYLKISTHQNRSIKLNVHVYGLLNFYMLSYYELRMLKLLMI